MAEELDNIEEFSAKETEHKLPLGFIALAVGLTIFGIVYFFMYTPQISGWSQEAEYQESVNK